MPKGRRKKTPIRYGQSLTEPPPLPVRRKTVFSEKNIFFYIIFRYAYQKMQNGLKVKTYVFMKEKNFGYKGKHLSRYFHKILKFFNGYPCKKVTKYVCIFFPFQNILHLFLFFSKKNTYFGYGQGVCPPPPFTDWSVTSRFFLTPSLSFLNY